MTRKFVSAAAVGLVFVALAVVARLVPHPPNFTPVASVALFAGFYFRRRAVAVCVPIVAMLASDAIIGTYDYRVTAVVYAAIALPVFLRSVLRGRYFLPRLAACTSRAPHSPPVQAAEPAMTDANFFIRPSNAPVSGISSSLIWCLSPARAS